MVNTTKSRGLGRGCFRFCVCVGRRRGEVSRGEEFHATRPWTVGSSQETETSKFFSSASRRRRRLQPNASFSAPFGCCCCIVCFSSFLFFLPLLSRCAVYRVSHCYSQFSNCSSRRKPTTLEPSTDNQHKPI
jgi:hypothetical protein